MSPLEQEPCGICRGRRVIDLIVHPPAISASFIAAEPPAKMPIYSKKTFPCPECSTPQNKIGIAAFTIQPDDLSRFEKRTAAMSKRAADGLFEFLRSSNVVQFTMNPDFSITASLGVVTDEHQSLIEQFSAARVSAAVGAVTYKAISNIQNWDPNHEGAHGRIGKDAAVRFILDAVKEIKK